MSLHPLEKLLRRFRQALGVRESQGSSSWNTRLYSLALEAITFGRGIPRAINSEDVIRLDPSCRFLGDSYEPRVCDWLKARVKPGQVVFDVGAQFGLYSIWFARWVGRSGKVFAFEPSPEALRILRRHIHANRVAEQVQIVPRAVGATDGEVSFFFAGADPQNSLATSGADTSGLHSVLVEVLQLDTFCEELNLYPDVLKIDTEGWELHILRGATRLLRVTDMTIVVEMHPYAWETAGYTRAEFENFLIQHDLNAIPLTGQADPLGEYGDVGLSRVPLSKADLETHQCKDRAQ